MQWLLWDFCVWATPCGVPLMSPTQCWAKHVSEMSELGWIVTRVKQRTHNSSKEGCCSVSPADDSMWECGHFWQIFSFCKKNQKSGFLSKTQHPNFKCWLKKKNPGTPLVVQWIRICLPKQGMWVQSLLQEDFACLQAPSPSCATTEPACCSYWSLSA